MPDTNYTALAAECEKKAEQGEKPVMEWSPLEQDGTTAKSRMEHGDYEVCKGPWNKSWDIRGKMAIHDLVEDAVRSKSPVAAQLFAEALLRDATRVLHQGVYNKVEVIDGMLQQTHGQIFDMCEHLGVKREDEPCDAWALRDAILKMEQSNDDLCTALCHATDQRMSKPGYTVDAMMSEIDDVRQRAIDKETAALRAELAAIKSKAVTIAVVDMPEDIGAAGAFVAPDRPGWTKLLVGLNMTFLGAGYGSDDEAEQKQGFKATFADVLAHELFHVCQYIAEKHLTEEQINAAIERGRNYPVETVDATEEIDRQRDEINALRAENQRLAGEVSRSREMLDSMNSDFHHLQANADTVCAALNELRAENQRLRTALEHIKSGTVQWFRTPKDIARAALSPDAPTAATPDPSKEAT